MDVRQRKAVFYGLVAGFVIIAITTLPMAIGLIAITAVPRSSTPDSVARLIVGFGMVLAQLSILFAPWSLPVAAVTGLAAVRSARAAIVSLNDAMVINFIASLLMAPTGAFGAALLLGIAVAYSNGVWSTYASPAMVCTPVFALVLFTLSLFGGMVYSVYILKLKYVQQSPLQ
jgi:voltage-gated potassium channel Kch